MRRNLPLFAAVLLGVVHTLPGYSQVSPPGPVPGLAPGPVGILGGHEFVPSSYVRDPFVRTFLRTGLGFGMTPALVVPLVTIGDTSIVGLQGSLLYALLDVEFQQTIRDWLAVRGSLRLISRLADETPALVSQGVTLVSAFDLGWLFRVYRSESFLLSGSLSVKNSALTDVYLQRFIEGIIETGGISRDNKLVQTTPTLRGGIGLGGAYAISDLVGLMFSGDVDYGESVDRNSTDTWSHRFAAAVDFNLLRSDGIPIGFLLGIGGNSDFLGIEGRRVTQTFFGRIGYTGSNEFSLGLDVGYQLTPVRGLEDKQGFLSGLIDTRLFF